MKPSNTIEAATTKQLQNSPANYIVSGNGNSGDRQYMIYSINVQPSHSLSIPNDLMICDESDLMMNDRTELNAKTDSTECVNDQTGEINNNLTKPFPNESDSVSQN